MHKQFGILAQRPRRSEYLHLPRAAIINHDSQEDEYYIAIHFVFVCR